MELETNLFIKNKENDVLDRGTKGERLLILFARIFTIVGSCWLISRLITQPENLGNWYNAFLIFVLSAPNVILLLGGEEAKRKRCIKKGQKIAAKLIDVEARQCEVAVKDFCIKPEHLSKSGYFLVK